MAAYDPKRPRPAELRDDPAPVDALLEPMAPAPTPAPEVAPTPAPEVLPEPEPTVVAVPASANGTEVPVAPAPEVGTANRAVLYAALGLGALVTVVLLVLRRRSRRGDSGSGN